MNRAHLAPEMRAKNREYPRSLQQNPPESLRKFRVVTLVRLILIERNRRRDLHRHMPDANRSSEAIQCAHQLLVKGGHRHWLQANDFVFSIAGCDQQPML